MSILLFLALIGLPIAFAMLARQENAFDVTIRVDASQKRGHLKEIWRFFGSVELKDTCLLLDCALHTFALTPARF